MTATQRINRRLAAIVAADVVGYSRLMGQDEAGILARLKAVRLEIIEPCLRAHQGRLVKTTGDGLLMEFASAVAAVSCALDIQAHLAAREATVLEDQRLRLRIGVNLGDVIHEKEDVFGDGVNVAARLEQMAEPGAVCVARNVFDQVRDRLALEHEYLGEQQVKNIARPVKVYRVRAGSGYAAAPLAPPRRRHLALAGGTAAAALALLAAAALAFWPTERASEPPAGLSSTAVGAELPREAPRLSIAVLPFANLSADPVQDYFADGITEDLITDLSRISGAFVIARSTSFTYKGKAVDVREIARELGVRYVLEGSMRRSEDRVRVNAQLIDAATGAHVWAERFDRELKDAFALQNEVTGRIARTLSLELIEAESRRARRGAPASLKAEDLALQGWVVLLNKPQTPETNAEAGRLIEQALALDTNSALAWTAAAYMHTRAGSFGWSDSRAESLRQAVAAGERAVQLAPNSSDAFYMLGYALRTSGQQERALAAMEQAIALNPNNPLPYHGVAYGRILLGRPEDAKPFLDQAFRLSPREPLGAVWHWTEAYALFLTGDDEGAIASATKAIGINPKFPHPYVTWAAAAAHLGREAEARAAVLEYLKHAGGFDTVAKVRERMDLSANPTYQRQLERLVAGLRKAGLPD